MGVSSTALITATLDSDVDATTVTTRTFAVHGSFTGFYPGALSYDPPSRTIRSAPSRVLKPGETLPVSATSGIRGPTGEPLLPRVWGVHREGGRIESPLCG